MQATQKIPEYVSKNLDYFLKKEAEGGAEGEEAEKIVNDICRRWNI